VLELQDISLPPTAVAGSSAHLESVSFHLDSASSLVAVLGSAATGTSLFRTLAGVTPHCSGVLKFNSTSLDSLRLTDPLFVALITNDEAPAPETPLGIWLTDRLKHSNLSPEISEERLRDALDTTALTELQTTPFKDLSTSQKVAARIASGLLQAPKLLLLDQLLCALNESEYSELLPRLKTVTQRGCTVLFTTDALESLTLPDSVLVLNEGHLVFHGTPAHVLHYFDVTTSDALPGCLAKRSAEDWSRSWRKHRPTYYKLLFGDDTKEHSHAKDQQPVAATIAPLPSGDEQRAAFIVEMHGKLRAEIGKLIVGQEEVIDQLLIAVLSGGHCLLEGVPGLAKTAVIRSLALAMQLGFRRIQFTPDLMPADITGTDILQEDPVTGRRNLVFQKGPIFTQMLLADEINRTPAKTQAALLEAMQEHSVTAGGHTLKLEQPFFVLATQNPIEQEGTYPLPEAQKDRFLFHVRVGYPDRESERQVIERTTSEYKADIQPVIDGPQILECQQTARRVPVPTHVMDFVLDLVRSTRPEEKDAPAFVRELLAWGAGPRACQCLVSAGKVRALLKGRVHVSIEDIEALALPVLRHRIVPTFNAESEGMDSDKIIAKLLSAVPRPNAKGLL
jgi:MoxR-like ATPase